MKPTNLNYLFIDLIRNFAHLVTIESQTKKQFLETVKQNYSLENQKNNLFYLACEKSDFDTIKLTNDRNSILFNQ